MKPACCQYIYKDGRYKEAFTYCETPAKGLFYFKKIKHLNREFIEINLITFEHNFEGIII